MKNKNLFFLLKTPKLKKEKTRNINFVDQTTILNSTIFRTNIESSNFLKFVFTQLLLKRIKNKSDTPKKLP